MANLKLNKKDTLIEVNIQENGEAWKKLLIKAKKDLIDNLELKGFRKGNVPANIAEQNIKPEQVWYKAADMLIDKEYSEAIKILTEEKIATRPSFEVISVSDDAIEAVLKAIAMPEVKLGKRDSIKVEYKVEEVKQEEIDAEVSQLDGLLQKQEEIKGAIEKDDIANIDFLGKVDGKTFEGGEAKGFDLKIGSKKFIDGFEEQLIGLKAGDEKNVEVTFPETYPSEELKGKPAVFEVKVNLVKRSVDLEGEELKEKLKSFGFEVKEEIIKKIEEIAAERKIQEAQDKFFREYVEAVAELKDTKLVIPDEIVKSEVDVEFKRMEAQIAQQGMKMPDYLKMLKLSEKEFKEQNLTESSKKRIRDGLVYQQLIDDLDVKAEEADIEAEYAKIAKVSKANIEDIKKQVQSGTIESSIIFKKLVTALAN